MIGFDRPIKPEWIYNTLKMIEIGVKPSTYNESFEKIVKDLIGKESKRKVRTIIFRSFMYSFQEGKSYIKPNIFIKCAKKEKLNDLKILFLLKIIIDYEIARFIIQKIAINIDNANKISASLLSKLIVKKYGDRDVVKRSLRSFLKTLVNFGLIYQGDKKYYYLSEKTYLSEKISRRFLILYAKEFLRSNVLDIQNIEPEFLFFFKSIDLQLVAHKFNSKDWEFIRDVNRNILILKNNIDF